MADKIYYPNQVVYNLEDYTNSGGLITTHGQDGKPINIFGITEQSSEGNPIFKDIFAQLGEDKDVYHLGIQAPPGTKFKMKVQGSSVISDFMVGRTGVYELTDDIKISQLYFERPHQWVLDPSQTEMYLNSGTNRMWNAKMRLDQSTHGLSLLNEPYQVSAEDWEHYHQAHTTYVEEYDLGRYEYMQGIGGVYVKGPDADLYNIIIDYLSSQKVEGA